MFNNILIVYSEKESEKHNSSVEKVKQLIGSKVKNIVNAKDLQANLFSGIDLVITIGGDGTFIRASSFLKEIPILGINSESEASEGALTSIDDKHLDKIKEILSGKFRIIKRKRIHVIRNNILLDKLALNDVFVGSRNQFHTSRYVLSFNGEEEEQRSSGVLIASGSGSTAWYQSAGGIPFDYRDEKMCFIIREIYSGRIFKPKLVKGCINKKESIKIISRMHNHGAIALDSDSVYDFNFGDEVVIQIADVDLSVVV